MRLSPPPPGHSTEGERYTACPNDISRETAMVAAVDSVPDLYNSTLFHRRA